VEAIGFMGSFVLEPETYKMKNAIFVATGTGIAPYYPMVAQLLEKGFEGKVYLAWGMRYEKDLYWWEKLEEIKEKHKNFDYEIVLSKPDERWRGKSGHVDDLIEKLSLDWKESCVYLCGGNEMIAQMKELFEGKGVAEERIYYEKFY
jgi:NAD(P)H-flavin reductase